MSRIILEKLANIAENKDSQGLQYTLIQDSEFEYVVRIAIALDANTDVILGLLRNAVRRNDHQTVVYIFRKIPYVTVNDVLTALRDIENCNVIHVLYESKILNSTVDDLVRLSSTYRDYRKTRYNILRRAYTPAVAHAVNSCWF